MEGKTIKKKKNGKEKKKRKKVKAIANSLYLNNGERDKKDSTTCECTDTMTRHSNSSGCAHMGYFPGTEPPVFVADLSYPLWPHVRLSTCIRSTVAAGDFDFVFSFLIGTHCHVRESKKSYFPSRLCVYTA